MFVSIGSALIREKGKLTETRENALEIGFRDNAITVLVDEGEGFLKLLDLGGLEEGEDATGFAPCARRFGELRWGIRKARC